MNIYSIEDTEQEETFYNTSDNYKITVKRVKIYDLVENPRLLLAFLNNGLRNIMKNLNFVEIGRSGKFFNATEKSNIENLIMYNGYKSNFVQL